MIGTARFDEIGEAFREGYRQYEEALSSVDGGKFQVSEEYGGAAENRIAVGDNLRYMAYLLREGAMEGKIQLIYVDPVSYTHLDVYKRQHMDSSSILSIGLRAASSRALSMEMPSLSFSRTEMILSRVSFFIPEHIWGGSVVKNSLSGLFFLSS